MNKLKQSSLGQPGVSPSINEFNSQDVKLINKYCSQFGYKPDFKNNTIYDGKHCHSVAIRKIDGIIYAVDNQYQIMERIDNNLFFHERLNKAMNKNGFGKFYNKYLSDAFGLVSLKCEEGGL